MSSAGRSLHQAADSAKANRAAKNANSYGKLVGAVVTGISGPSQAEKAYEAGAVGEEKVGAALDKAAKKAGGVVLHSRLPYRGATRGDIDHIVILASGVWVVDAKNYRNAHIHFVKHSNRTDALWVGKRNSERLIEGVLTARQRVRDVLTNQLQQQVTVEGALCFLSADGLGFSGSRHHRGVLITKKSRVGRKLLSGDAELSRQQVQRVETILSAAFPPVSC
jgi:hypothetical protein